MKRVQDWAPWVKGTVGVILLSMDRAISIHDSRVFKATGEISSGPMMIMMGSLLFLAGLLFLIWGGVQALRKRPRLAGAFVLALGLVLLPLAALSMPALWEWAKGGVVGFVPAPFLVPVVLVIPALVIGKGWEMLRSHHRRR